MRTRIGRILAVFAVVALGVSSAAGESPNDVWWSFRPLRRPAVPDVRNGPPAIRNPIDAFVSAKLQTAGIAPASEADRRVLIRRLSFDLIGLPPTPAEVADFLADTTP